jgi:hypothetical protein
MAKPLTKTRPRAGRGGVTPPALPAPAPQPEAQAPLLLPRFSGLGYAAALALAFFMPMLGLGLALLYAPQTDLSARKFGRWCLVLAVLGAVAAAATGAVKDIGTDGDWLIQPYD